MNPAYSKRSVVNNALNKNIDIFTNHELNSYGITGKTLHELDCDIFNGLTEKNKTRLKNTFIKNSDSGFYEYNAKNIECIQDKLESTRRRYKALNLEQSTTNQDEFKKRLEKKNKFKTEENDMFRKIKNLCYSTVSELCEAQVEDTSEEASKDENNKIRLKNDYEVEKLKKISYDELGPNRRLKLMIRGYKYENNEWKYDPALKDKFKKAINICHKNKHCMHTYSSLDQIPIDTKKFINLLIDGIKAPLVYTISQADSMKKKRSEIIEKNNNLKKKKLENANKNIQKKKKNIENELEKTNNYIDQKKEKANIEIQALENKQMNSANDFENVRQTYYNKENEIKNNINESKQKIKELNKNINRSTGKTKKNYKKELALKKKELEKLKNEKNKELKEYSKEIFTKKNRKKFEKIYKKKEKLDDIIENKNFVTDKFNAFKTAKDKYYEMENNINKSKQKIKELNNLVNISAGEIKKNYKEKLAEEKASLKQFKDKKNNAKQKREITLKDYNNSKNQLKKVSTKKKMVGTFLKEMKKKNITEQKTNKLERRYNQLQKRPNNDTQKKMASASLLSKIDSLKRNKYFTSKEENKRLKERLYDLSYEENRLNQ